TYTYDAFGVEQNIDSNDTNPFRYCGEYYDSEIEQIYLRVRYYDPALGRFTQQDPARDGENWYVYCKNNPVNLVDVTGKWGEDVHYYDTLQWALEAGFSKKDAETIAYYDNNTDNLFNGISPIPHVGDQTYHFDRDSSDLDTRLVHAKENLGHAIWQKKQAVKNYNSAMAELDPNDEDYGRKKQEIEYQYELDKAYALKFLGEGLHALQDVDAHGQIGINNGWLAEHLTTDGFERTILKDSKVDNRNFDWTDSSSMQVEKSNDQARYKSTEGWSRYYLSLYFSEQEFVY
ncbi:MAG: RHS repeat-associated core domain-containing protein, partial [Clostridia bacterium]|nr:RHS repeat-associated core domain-containing protein [Clostridia bacterium]